MKVTTFTDTMIKNLKKKEKKYLRGEGNGFNIRVMPSGAKTWLYVYDFDGKRREMKLGQYDPEYINPVTKQGSLAEARSKFEDARRKAINGIDPMAEKEQAAEDRRKASTVAGLIKEYLGHAEKNKKSWKEDERILNKDVLPTWKDKKAKDIIRRDVMSLLDGMQGRGNGIITSTFKIIRRMFTYAVKREIVATSPCYAFERGDELPQVTSRERTLSEDEVRIFWTGLDNSGMSEDVRRVLKLIILTSQRPGEVTSMHRKDIVGRWWEFTPKETAITREIPRLQRVYLTDTMLQLIGEGDSNEYVFKGYSTKKPKLPEEIEVPMHITVNSISHALRRNLLGHVPKKSTTNRPHTSTKPKKKKPFVVSEDRKLNIAHFTPHDLRRTAATLISELGFTDATVDAILAHLKRGEIRTYNKNKYDKEKQQALEAWDRKLNSIITGRTSNVISLQGHHKKAVNE